MNIIYIDCFNHLPDEKPPKKEKLRGNYEKILIMDLKKKFGTLECFRFLSCAQIENLLRRNYRNLNKLTLYFATCRICIDSLDEEFTQKSIEQINFVGLVIDFLKKRT